MSSNQNNDIEELLKIASMQTQEITSDDKQLPEAQRFALHYGIKSGEFKVRAAIVYEMYKKWKGGKNLQTKTRFFTDFGKLFEKYQNAHYVYYKLDPTPFDLDDEIYKKMRDAIIK